MPKHKFFILLSLFALLGVTGCSEHVESPAGAVLPKVRVQVETVALSAVPFQVEVAGTVAAVDQALISARVSGQLVAVPVRVGSQVKKGELLAKISAAEIAAQVLRAEALYSQAKRNLERETKLQKANASTRETVSSLQEMVQIAEAAYSEAKAMLDYTLIKAPFSGTLTQKLVEVGDLAAPGKPLFQLENGTVLQVVTQIPGSLVQGLKLGDQLRLSIPAAGLAIVAGISEIAPTVDPQSRTTQVKLKLPEHAALHSGQFARVSLVDKASATLLIPGSALRQSGQMIQVFVADQGVARLRLIRTGAGYEEQVEVLSGLKPGDRLIIASKSALRDSQPLEIVAAETSL